MGRNLTNLYISQSFQFLTQISGSELQTGLGDTITGSLLITASKADTATTAVSASYSNVATSASYALVSTSSSLATNATNASTASIATSASYALTASFALNAGATVSTASLLTTASAVANVITFTKGDGSTFPVTIATGSAVSASFASTASLALNNVLTASSTNDTITYTKGDGTTFNNVINNVVNANSASVATSASYAVSASQAQNAVTASFALNVTPINTGSFVTTASISNATTTFTKGDGSTFALTANNVVNANSASVAISASQAVSASFASNIASGLSPTFANVTASNVLITGTASVALLYTQTVSSSVIYSSGSNQFGDASNDVQTLYGTVDIKNGPVAITGSVNITGSDLTIANGSKIVVHDINAGGANGIEINNNGGNPVALFGAGGSQGATFYGQINGTTFVGTASLATSASQAVSSSFATTASFVTSASYAVSASQAQNAVSASYAPAANPFPFTGSAVITGSLVVTGSISTNSPETILGNNSKDQVLVGRNAGKNLNSGGYNTLVGADRFGGTSGAGSSMTSPTENVAIGASAGQFITDGDQNTIVGTLAGYGANASQNTFVGYAIGQALAAGSDGNVAVGRWTGYDLNGQYNVLMGWRTGFETTGNRNIFLGPDINGQGAGRWTSSSYLAIGSSQVTSDNLLYGYHGTAQQRFLNINGNLNTSGSGNFVGKLTISQSQNDFTAGAFDLYSVRNAQSLITMYEYGGQAVIKAPRANGLFQIDGGGGANDYVGINYNSLVVYPGQVRILTSASIEAPANFTSGIGVTGGINVTSGSFSGSVITNITDTYTSSAAVQQVVTLTQTEYNAIGSPNANTLYIISGSVPFNSSTFATTGSNTFVGNQTISGSLTVTGSATFTNTTVFSGSVRGEVGALSITSNTASLNLATDNFFTLTLGDGANCFINPSNIQPGQTINLRVTNGSAGTGTVSFPSSVKQVSGSAYVPTATPNAVDIVTFIAFDSTNLYLSNIKKFV